MASEWDNPDNSPRWPELPDSLRSAVEQVRQSPPPPAALDRAVMRARQIGRHRPAYWSSRGIQLFAATLAASTLFIALGLRDRLYPSDSYLARKKNNIGKSTMELAKMTIAREDRGFTGSPLFVRGGARPASREEWERVEALRDLSRGMPPVDRQGIEDHIRRLPPRKTHPRADLRVTVRWSVEASVVLTIIDPNGRRKDAPPLCATGHGRMCFHELREADPGEYEVEIRLSEEAPPPDGAVSVEVRIVSHYGSADERTYLKTVRLGKIGQRIRVARIVY
jgi:hypothetical protein